MRLTRGVCLCCGRTTDVRKEEEGGSKHRGDMGPFSRGRRTHPAQPGSREVRTARAKSPRAVVPGRRATSVPPPCSRGLLRTPRHHAHHVLRCPLPPCDLPLGPALRIGSPAALRSQGRLSERAPAAPA